MGANVMGRGLRKNPSVRGDECPSFIGYRNEKDTTRARANTIERVADAFYQGTNWYDHVRSIEVRTICLLSAVKGCKSECLVHVDVAKLKANSCKHYYDATGCRSAAALAYLHGRRGSGRAGVQGCIICDGQIGCWGFGEAGVAGYAPDRRCRFCIKTTLDELV